jgi:enoyl-CoA hydratase/carnithine racemase
MSIRIQDKDGVRTIAFARPEKKNAITGAMYLKIVEALSQSEADPAIKVVLFASTNEILPLGMMWVILPPTRRVGLTRRSCSCLNYCVS